MKETTRITIDLKEIQEMIEAKTGQKLQLAETWVEDEPMEPYVLDKLVFEATPSPSEAPVQSGSASSPDPKTP